MVASRRVRWLALPLAHMPACARPSFDASAEAQKLLRRDAEWSAAAAAGKDVEKILSYLADDAGMKEPGEPAHAGKAEIRKYVTRMLQTPGFSIRWVSEDPVFSPSGNMAYMRGANETTMPGPGGAIATMHLRGVSIWRRESDGEWRCIADIGNDPSPSADRSGSSPPTSSNR
jgi:ketosteroid isomerase-like protein